MTQFGASCPEPATFVASVLFCLVLAGLGLSQIRVPLRGRDGGEPVRRELTEKVLTGEETYRKGITVSDAYGYLAAAIGGFGVVYLTVRAAQLCLL